MTLSSLVSSPDKMISSFLESALPKIALALHLQKPGESEGRAERELLLDPIQERRRDLWLPKRTSTRRSLQIHSTGTTFVILPDPGPLIILSGGYSVTLGNLHRDHSGAVREFKEWVNLERAGKKKSQKE